MSIIRVLLTIAGAMFWFWLIPRVEIFKGKEEFFVLCMIAWLLIMNDFKKDE